MLIRTTNQKRQ